MYKQVCENFTYSVQFILNSDFIFSLNLSLLKWLGILLISCFGRFVACPIRSCNYPKFVDCDVVISFMFSDLETTEGINCPRITQTASKSWGSLMSYKGDV